ncbi:transmembrane and coiled-coil domain-containing protein 4 isoform 2-T17 [Molossus nigricans]
MATGGRSSHGLHQEAEPAVEGDPRLPTGRELSEANRFAYAAVCGISLSQLFPEPEQSSFCTEFVTGLVTWLELSEAVLPTMTAFASGLGGEGADMFAQMLMKDPILKDDPLVIIQDLLSFSLKDGRYDARARVLLCHMTSLLGVASRELDLLEETFLESLKDSKEEESETAEASRKKRENRRKWKRYLLIGLATVGGGTVIGVTGGLAAPLVAAGAATIIGSAGAAALGSVAGIAVMTSLFGAAGASLTGYKMKKRVGAIEEFTFLPLTEGRQLHITIAITGWLASGKYREDQGAVDEHLQRPVGCPGTQPRTVLPSLGGQVPDGARQRPGDHPQWACKHGGPGGPKVHSVIWHRGCPHLAGLPPHCRQRHRQPLGGVSPPIRRGWQAPGPHPALAAAGPATCHFDWLQPGSQSHLLLPARDGAGERLPGDHRGRRPAGCARGRRSQALGAFPEGGVRQDHQWLLQGGLAAELRVPHVLGAGARRRPAARAAAGQEGGERGPVFHRQWPLGLCQADGRHPEGRGHPHQAKLG